MARRERKFVEVAQKAVRFVVHYTPLVQIGNPVGLPPVRLAPKCFKQFIQREVGFSAHYNGLIVGKAFIYIISRGRTYQHAICFRTERMNKCNSVQIGFYRKVYRPDRIEIAVVV